jgi:SNF2 family DNA or RNA helicase
MLTREDFHDYQEHSITHVIEHSQSGLFLDMGLGKTATVLTAVDELLNVYCEISKTLVIAPLRVAEHTWISEAKKWKHLQHLTFSLILGPEVQRKQALRKQADIYLINRENVAWLVSYLAGSWPFDMLVIDELSSFKSAKSVRFKALRQVRPKVKRVTGLTGTPTPNGLVDLWSQMYLLDMGERLGKSLTGYRQEYFTPNQRNGHIVYNYKIKKDSEERIYDKIEDICISMKAEDYLKLPKRVDQDLIIEMPVDIRKQYEKFEMEQLLSIDDINAISPANAAALSNKLRQYANGAVYDDKKLYHEMHMLKIEALEDILDSMNGQPLLCFYQFRHDVERIKKYLKNYEPYEIGKASDVDRWNRKEIPFMLAHALSAGHGLNMQDGGNHLVWVGVDWPLEPYQQAVKRLDRQGQIKTVINKRLILKGTIDEDVVKSLENKAVGQDALMYALKARVKKYKMQTV